MNEERRWAVSVEQDFGRIAAIVGARQPVGGTLDWQLVEYDEEALRFIGASFKPDKNGEGVGTKFFVFMPKKIGTSLALLEFKKGDSLQGRLKVTVVTDKWKISVVTEEVK
jgi:hypothetical protein